MAALLPTGRRSPARNFARNGKSRECSPHADEPEQAARVLLSNALESIGRLTQPMRYDTATDHYVPVSWESAFADLGERLRRNDVNSAVFYAAVRADLDKAQSYACHPRRGRVQPAMPRDAARRRANI